VHKGKVREADTICCNLCEEQCSGQLGACRVRGADVY